MFEKTLLDRRAPEAPRNYGFFLMVRDRLVNPDDELLLLPDPSFGTFYRCQFVIHADGLDQDLLADRERLQRNTPRTKELAILQRAMYLAARNELERLDQRGAREQRSESLLPVDSREYFREPLTALLVRHDRALAKPFDLSETRVERAPLSEDEPLAKMGDEGALQVNLTHPLLASVRQRLGEGRIAQRAMQVFDLFAVSERLLEGYLYDLGLPGKQIDEVLDWRDELFRAMAARFKLVPAEEVVRQARAASYVGDTEFEDALRDLFTHMGFEATRDGASGHKDVLVVAPIGQQQYRFTVEAKGYKDPVDNHDAAIGAAASHRDQVGADWALVVAREFAGFRRRRDEEPAVLQECRASGKVSIAELDILVELYDAIHQYGYPLELLLPVLAEVERPDDKLRRVRTLQHPTRDFDYRGVLEEIWKRQQDEAAGDLVAYRTVWQSGCDKWGEPDIEGFERRLLAMESLSRLMRVSTQQQVVTILQSPTIVADSIQRAVEAKREAEDGRGE